MLKTIADLGITALIIMLAFVAIKFLASYIPDGGMFAPVKGLIMAA